MRLKIAIFALVISFVKTVLAADFPPDIAGDGLVVHIDDALATSTGTITRSGRTYSFVGTTKDQTLVGSFKVGIYSYPFILTNAGDHFILRSDGATYNLVRSLAPNVTAKPDAPLGLTALAWQTLHDPTSKLSMARVLVPDGWKVDEQADWQVSKAQFVCNTSGITDTEHGLAVRWLPRDQFECSPAVYENARQTGSSLMHNGSELADHVPDSVHYIQEVVLPRYLDVAGLRVVGMQNLDNVAAEVAKSQAATIASAAKAGFTMQYSGARLRVEYPGERDVMLQGDIYCILEVYWSEQGNAMARNAGLPGGQVFTFVPERLYSFTASKGQLDAQTPLLQTIASSLRPAVKWVSYVDNLAAMMRKAAMDDNAMAMAAQMEISESQQATWKEQCAAEDKVADAVGHILSGTAAYKGAKGGAPVELPVGSKAWMKDDGTVVYSRDGVDPTVEDRHGTYTPMEAQ